MTFASFDVETANHLDPSLCAAAVALFENGIVKQSRSWLVRPPRGFGWFRPEFIECHGLTWFDVRESPEFPKIAPDLLGMLRAADFVIAHNAAFDMQKLRGTLDHFDLAWPEFQYLCTMQAARQVWPGLPNHRLDTVAASIAHSFKHHDPRQDAEAAAHALLAMMRQGGVATAKEFIHLHDLTLNPFQS